MRDEEEANPITRRARIFCLWDSYPGGQNPEPATCALALYSYRPLFPCSTVFFV